jgi:ATP-dependent RNA helicase DHX37/DHR1
MSVNRKKRKYNWKARIVPANEEEVTASGRNETQSSNPPGSAKPEKLSRRERKRLQKILQVKEQKRKRAAVIDKLQALALPSDELKMLASFNGAKRKHSHGRERKKIKKPKLEEFDGDASDDDDNEGDPLINTDDLIPYDTPSIDDCTTTNTSDKCTDTVATCTTPAVTFTTTTTTTNDTVQSGSATTTPAVYMTIDRCPDVQAARLLLPIISEEHSILEGIIENDVVVICGATGSGKTTQVPQFLYEAGYTLKVGGAKMIGVTQPRRVAAINMSRRVAMEMNMSSNEISYQIRYRGTSSPSTLVKFMTDGVLLKEIEKVGVVIIRKSHPLGFFADELFGDNNR